jgi:RHS repeat-associated protein
MKKYFMDGKLILKNGKVDMYCFDGVFCSLDNNNGRKQGLYYYNKDHLGNNREVVAADGTIAQTNNYYPFGAPFNEGSSSSSELQPYKYNGKELDRMHGLDTYDYGARNYDAVIPAWTSIDPLCEKYYSISPYAYGVDNPINSIDPDGRKVIFVNGYLGFGSPKGGPIYWNGTNSSFVKGAQSTFKDYATPYFTNFDYKYLESASTVRGSQGYQYAKHHYKALTKDMKPGDKFNFVSHSMGGAFAEGMIMYMAEQGWQTENAVFLNAWEPAQINTKKEKTRIDATCTNDPVQLLSEPTFGKPDIPSSDDKIRIKSKESIIYVHKDLIYENSNKLWTLIKKFLAK